MKMTKRNMFLALLPSVGFIGTARMASANRQAARNLQWSGGITEMSTTPFVKAQPWVLSWTAEGPIEILVYDAAVVHGRGQPIMRIQQAENGVGTAHVSTVGHFYLHISAAARWTINTRLAN